MNSEFERLKIELELDTEEINQIIGLNEESEVDDQSEFLPTRRTRKRNQV